MTTKRSDNCPISIHAGKKARAHLQQFGLRAADIAVIPAAAGGPKGLILQALDQWLFGTWLPAAPRARTLIGASIGAWRMAAACQQDPAAAFQRLADLYCAQHYPRKPPPHLVSSVCQKIIDGFISGHESEIISHPWHRLQVLTARGKGSLADPQHQWAARAGFAAATFANARSRSKLTHYLERVVIGDARDPAAWLKTKFDQFDTHFAALTADNVGAALLASGTLPLIMQPVQNIPHAPRGTYWDGGLVDYHLAFPYTRMAAAPDAGLVLYPHFVDHIVPGWLDKHLRWRRANPAWLDNVILVSPTRAFVQTLPRHKLPDRKDFTQYGFDHELRRRNWKRAIAESARLRDAFASFAEKPDFDLIKPI